MSASDQSNEAIRIGVAAADALRREAEATPKPGLVDCADSGAHTDMDISTFHCSIAALRPYFIRFAARGMEEATLPETGCFAGIRPLGMEAERAMFAATGNVNTHKGAVFTLGILTYVCGRMHARQRPYVPEDVCAAAASLVSGVQDELAAGKAGTKGERAFRAYGATGIRGEAAAGFPHVLHTALPHLLRRDIDANTRTCHALMHLIAQVDDTNVLTRAGRSGLLYAQSAARAFLAAYAPQNEDYLPALSALNRDFTARNLSPGGCADLVAAAWFLDSIRPNMIP